MDSSCFFCTTPFQIISAILLTSEIGIDSDLYIVPQFKTASELASAIASEKIFRNVCVVDTDKFEGYKRSRTKLGLYWGIIRNYIEVDGIVDDFLLENRDYKHLYISSKANVGRLVSLYYYKKKRLPQIHYIDDGESSYDNKKIIEASKADRVIRLLVFGVGVNEISEVDRYLFSPELYSLINPDSTARIFPMPEITNKVKELILRVFDISKENLVTEPVLIVDILKSENMVGSESEKLIWLYKDIIEQFGKENVVIKKHPRDRATDLDIAKYYTDYSIPLEALCIASDFQYKILISAGSTAIVLPKILFGAEPIVILLNKLVTTKQYEISKAEQYYEMCRSIYSDKTRFIIPNSIEEFREIIQGLSEEFL